jgi:hypothetical protein
MQAKKSLIIKKLKFQAQINYKSKIQIRAVPNFYIGAFLEPDI